MARKEKTTPPTRKEPGFVARLFSGLIAFVCWLIAALVVSILIEWVGITWCWPEQGHQHAKSMLDEEKQYLNQQVIQHSRSLAQKIHRSAMRVNVGIERHFNRIPFVSHPVPPLHNHKSRFHTTLNHFYHRYQAYILAIPLISQLFIVRIAIIVFSTPAFFILATVGIVDGLVERELRRWGGGRESSNLYNIARKLVCPVLMSACFFYISLPVTLHPAVILIPFALLWGFVIRLTLSQFKKYF